MLRMNSLNQRENFAAGVMLPLAVYKNVEILKNE